MYERLPHFVSASPLAPLNRAIDAVEEMRRSSTPGDYEQHFGTSAGGLVDKSLLPIRIKITGGSNPYTWVQQIQKTSATYINTFKDPSMYFGRADKFPAIEINGRTDVPTGTIVNGVIDRLYGKILFEYSAPELPQDEIQAQLLSRSGFAFAWREMEQKDDGTMIPANGGLSGNLTFETLYEMNQRTDAPLNTNVTIWPGFGWNPTITANTAQDGTGYIPEIHRFWLENVAGGNYTLSYKGDDTAPIAWNASCTTIANTLTSCTTIGNVSVTGSGTYTSPYLVQHLDDNLDHPPLTADGHNLTGKRLWMFEYTPPSTSNLTSVTNLTVTNTFQSDNQTTVNNNFTINANTTYVTGFNYTIYSAVNFYTAITTFNSNSTLYIYAPTTFYSASFLYIYAPTFFYSTASLYIYSPTFYYTSNTTYNSNASLYIYAPTFWFGPQTHTYNGNFTYNYFGGDTVKNYTGSNLTMNFIGLFGLTICGNTTLCANKTLTLPTIKGNNALDILQLIPKPTANATLPAMLSVENAAIQTTMISTPSMSANSGMMQMYFKADEKLYKRNPSGTETEIGVGTGNGTSNGTNGTVQLADGSGGFNGFHDDFNYSDGNVTMAGAKLPVMGGFGNHLVYADNNGTLKIAAQPTTGQVLFANNVGLPIGGGLTWDAVTGMLNAEQLTSTDLGGFGIHIVVSDNNGTLQNAAGLLVNQVPFADANGSPIGGGLRFDGTNLTIEALAGGGDRALRVDNNGTIYAV